MEISDFESLSNSLLERNIDTVKDIQQQQAIMRFVDSTKKYCLRVEQFAA